MKRIVQFVAVAATLAAFPVLADQRDPTAGSDRDPFAQTYTGRDPDGARAERERERAASPCDRSCPCGHKKTPKESSKA